MKQSSVMLSDLQGVPENQDSFAHKKILNRFSSVDRSVCIKKLCSLPKFYIIQGDPKQHAPTELKVVFLYEKSAN